MIKRDTSKEEIHLSRGIFITRLNNKLTRALECLQSQKRFLSLWMDEGQSETYDEIRVRMRKIDTAIAVIEERADGPYPPLEVPERWKKKT